MLLEIARWKIQEQIRDKAKRSRSNEVIYGRRSISIEAFIRLNSGAAMPRNLQILVVTLARHSNRACAATYEANAMDIVETEDLSLSSRSLSSHSKWVGGYCSCLASPRLARLLH